MPLTVVLAVGVDSSFLTNQRLDLQSAGCYLIHARSIRDALTQLKEGDFDLICDKVRRLGLAVSASAKLVSFLLEECATRQKTERGARLFCSLTHEEIGECIGVSRETVTRLFSEFKGLELMESRGSTLFISDRRALETYAGVE